MNSTTTLRLNRLVLRNFRCFAECEIDLHPELTVLVAENGSGKTAILDAIRIALGLVVDTVSGTRQFADIEPSDVRRVAREGGMMAPAEPTELRVDGEVSDQSLHWRRVRNSARPRARTVNRRAEAVLSTAEALSASVATHGATASEDSPNLPLVAFYGTDRLWGEYRPIPRKRARAMRGEGRMAGYEGCLSSSSSITEAARWYGDQATYVSDPRYRALPDIARPDRILAAVRDATRIVLAPTGWAEIDWDFDQEMLVVEHPTQGRLPLSSMSDGIRTMAALVIDIARRCAILNPHLSDEAARQTIGVVLIDEIDLHLHPRWQQQVVDLLRQAFPAIQLVLSTHSPHVLSTIDSQSIRIVHLRDGKVSLDSPQQQTRGVESAAVLAEVMDVDPIPKVDEAEWLSEYRALLQTDRHESKRGQILWNDIIAHFGVAHSIVREIETLIRLHEFKQMHGLHHDRDS